MVFPQPNLPDKPSPTATPPPPNPNLLQQAFSNLHTNCNGFFRGLQSSLQRHFPLPSPFQNPNAALLNSRLQSAFSNLQSQVSTALQPRSSPVSSVRSPAWARIPSPGDSQAAPAVKRSGVAVADDDLEDRLSGVVVYSLCNSNENFVLISSPRSKASMSFFFFAEDDADSLLQQMKSIDPRTSDGTKVVAVPLNKVYKLKSEGVAFRFIPQTSQIKNAVQGCDWSFNARGLPLRFSPNIVEAKTCKTEMQRAGYKGSFSGVPVFQSESLVVKGQNKTYRPVFFRKEDLEDILRKAYGVPGNLSPMPKQVDIQVGAFEEMMSVMKDTSSNLEDVVFIPPGFEIGNDPSRVRPASSS